MTSRTKIQFILQQEIMRMAQITTLTPQQDLFAEGILGSLHALELVHFIEERFQLTLEDEELSRDNFQTLASLTNMTAQKQQ